MVWLEPRRVHAGGQPHPFSGAADELTRILGTLPLGPTGWVVDDAWAPTLLLRDIVELPPGVEAREAFFRWRYAQDLLLDQPQFVQAMPLEDNAWLLAGMPQHLRDEWVQAAAASGRPMRRLVPRWLWLYNRLAPARELPGLLLSLAPAEDGRTTGTLAAWGRNLLLLRQWSEPALADDWCQERVLPTIAYLQRDARSPQELHVWGAAQWPDCGLPTHFIQPEIPAQEPL
jgi:hypothetical protein